MDNDRERFMELGNFLKTRRQRVSPDEVGLPKGQRRRTSGLRREELAQLVGICSTWYTYLEQGRPIRVSAQVLESLARILHLDEGERAYLFLLAHQQPPPVLPEEETADAPTLAKTETSGQTPVRPEGVKQVSPALLSLLDSMGICPAYIMDQRFNMLAWNKAAGVVFEELGAQIDGWDRNRLWVIFTNPGYRQFFVDWERRARLTLGQFRVAYGQNIGNEWYKKFVDNLMEVSPEFSKWWHDHDIQGVMEGCDELNHPVVGYMKLDHISLAIPGSHNLTLQVYTPVAGTGTADKIMQLMVRPRHYRSMFFNRGISNNTKLTDIPTV